MNKLNNNRLKEFRQLKEEIRGSKEYLIVGIDIAKDKHNAFFGTATGKTLFKGLVFENNREGFEKLVVQAEAIKVQNGLKKVVYGMEPTANYHKPLGEYLIKGGHGVVLVSGFAVKRNRGTLDGRWDKHDMKDAANVADLISQGKCQYYEYPSEGLRDLRNLLSLKRRLKRQEHGMRVRIRNHLIAQYYPEMDGYYGRSEREGLAVVRWCLSPQVIAGMKYEEFRRLVGGRYRSLCQEQRLRAIWEEAGSSIGCKVGKAVSFEGKMMVEMVKGIREAIGETEAKIKDIGEQYPSYAYLLTIPGFGPDVASKVLGAIGDPFRFQRGSQVLNLAGLDLSADRSGRRSEGVTPMISKKGKAELRYALYQAALIASVRNRYFIEYYTNKLRGREKEKGIKTKMRVKLAAKLLIIAWTLMKKGELFDPEHLHRGYKE
jgi:transposase